MIWKPDDNGFKCSFELIVKEPERINLLYAHARLFITPSAAHNQGEGTVSMIYQGQISQEENVYPPENDIPVRLEASNHIKGTLTIFLMRTQTHEHLKETCFRNLCMNDNDNPVSTINLKVHGGHEFSLDMLENAESPAFRFNTEVDFPSGSNRENTLLKLVHAFFSNISQIEIQEDQQVEDVENNEEEIQDDDEPEEYQDDEEIEENPENQDVETERSRQVDANANVAHVAQLREMSLAFQTYENARNHGLTAVMEFSLASIYEDFTGNHSDAAQLYEFALPYLNTNGNIDANIQNLINYCVEIFQL